jgi:hypothetical protein
MGFYGWGPRLGLGDDPDQVIVGIHQDLGEFADRWRFQPNLEVGFGDDHTIVSGTLPVHYRIKTDSKSTPYLGVGLVAAWIDRDRPSRSDDSEFEISAALIGGVEWPIARASDIFGELHLGGGDSHEAKLLLGWIFRAK